MATTTLASTLNTPLSELRPATMDRILVIADDSALRKALQRFFSLEGYEVEVVTDSIAGLARLHERPFSAVILDLQRPDRRGGTFAGKLRIRFPVSRLSFLAQAPMLPTRSFSWKWAPTIT